MSRKTRLSLVGGAANRSIVGFGHVTVGPAVEQCRHQNTRRWNAPRQQLFVAEQMVDGGAHERYGLVAIPAPSPLTRRVDLKQR